MGHLGAENDASLFPNQPWSRLHIHKKFSSQLKTAQKLHKWLSDTELKNKKEHNTMEPFDLIWYVGFICETKDSTGIRNQTDSQLAEWYKLVFVSVSNSQS